MSEVRGQLERFYVEHRQRLFTCALAITGCADLAEDSIADVFARLFRRPFVPRHLKAYVFRAVRNAAIDTHRRRAKRFEPLNESIFSTDTNPRDDAASREFQEQVSAALSDLPDNERETIILHLYGELTFREIAEIRSARLGTVTSWYRRGLEKLRDQLEQ